MALHPIVALDHVIDEYRDYLLTEFRAKDDNLRLKLQEALNEPGFLAQEPFFQAHRPFKQGSRWKELPMESQLAAVMESRARKHGSQRPEFAYRHQSKAIRELLSDTARSVVITTGTGSGKTEGFLLPVIQNAIRDAQRFKKPGLTAILVYPMNALANDQLGRINTYLDESGFSGSVSVEKYDRGTSQAQRDELRKSPPHILLTNYMMLEYLLVRPADRDGIFANHRCRFLVLDEVHTYRGSLGSNIAFLMRRLRAHLGRATQDWMPKVADEDKPLRFPEMIPVGTSATIKSISENEVSAAESRRLRDEAVQEFFARLTGVEPSTIQVFGEEIEEIQAPGEAVYSKTCSDPGGVNPADAESIRSAITKLAGIDSNVSLEQAVSQCRLIWDLSKHLTGSPMSVSGLVSSIKECVPERADADDETLAREIEAALVAGGALPDEIAGALRLRVHRFIRGGWRFHRCLNPTCGRLYPMGQDRCDCGNPTAPLYLCRNCGADYVRFVGDPEEGPLRPMEGYAADDAEWVLYEPTRFETVESDEDIEEEVDADNPPTPKRRGKDPTHVKQRPVLHGSFDPAGKVVPYLVASLFDH